MDNKTPNKNNFNKWLVFMGIPFQMGIVIFLFTYFGIWLDEKYSNGSSSLFWQKTNGTSRNKLTNSTLQKPLYNRGHYR